VNWTYFAIMTAAVTTGALLYRRTGLPLDMTRWQKVGVGLGAFCGGMIGAKLPFLLSDWQGFLDGTAWLDDGKTIVSGLVGGYLGVQAAEWAMGVKSRMCDGFAVPLAAAIGIGRLACFSAGCCYGKATSLPWGVDFGDGLHRHPTQLYESAFHLTAAAVLWQLQRRGMFRGQLVKLYFLTYFAYRFLTEFIRPEEPLWLGLTGYQWAALVLAPFFFFWCRIFCGVPDEAKEKGFMPLAPDESLGNGEPRLLKTTGTLCPKCLKAFEGSIVERDGRVYLDRHCAEHGETAALVNSDRRLYYLRHEVPHAPPPTLLTTLPILDAPKTRSGCGCSPGHKTCIALLEITDACNLRCPVCFAGSPAGRHRSFAELRADLQAFLNQRGPLDVIQLSGGEPLLHPELLPLIDFCKTLPIRFVTINTNGLELLVNDALAVELARRKSRLEINFQMDGLDPAAHLALRGEDLLARKRAALERIAALGIPFTLVCTVARAVNEHQLGDLLRFGLGLPLCRGITFQTATHCGRFEEEFDPLDRVTMADVVRLLIEQSGGLLQTTDFKPLPCSNPNCCSFTGIARPKNRPLFPLMRLFKYEKHIDRLADRLTFDLQDIKECCGREGRAEDFFRIVIKPFMDAYTYDQERAAECCVHIIRPGGDAVSFCRFNILDRGGPLIQNHAEADKVLSEHQP
jgi:uncharacterized radical SAM superfamily Fe-S cluster-containing enzyme/prolipoprotein diacylglyceryltransferase